MPMSTSVAPARGPRCPRAATALLLLLALPLAAGCGGGGAAATGPARTLVVAEMVLEDGTGTVYYSHRDHWHGFPVAPANGELAVRKYFVARSTAPDDHEMPPRAEWFTLEAEPDARLTIVVADTTVGGWRGDRVQGALVGRRAGATALAPTVFRGPTTLRQLPSLPLVVR